MFHWGRIIDLVQGGLTGLKMVLFFKAEIHTLKKVNTGRGPGGTLAPQSPFRNREANRLGKVSGLGQNEWKREIEWRTHSNSDSFSLSQSLKKTKAVIKTFANSS